MKTTEVIDTVLGTSGRIKILRRLEQSPQPLTGRQIAELAGLSHRGAAQAIAPLVEAGVVKQRRIGRANQYSLEKNNIITRDIVLPALAAERHLLVALKHELVRLFASDSLSLVLFGSYARGEATWHSDLDVLVLVSTRAEKTRVEEATEGAAAPFRTRFGATLSVHVLQIDEVNNERQPAFLEQAAKDGVLLHGTALAGLVRKHG